MTLPPWCLLLRSEVRAAVDSVTTTTLWLRVRERGRQDVSRALAVWFTRQGYEVAEWEAASVGTDGEIDFTITLYGARGVDIMDETTTVVAERPPRESVASPAVTRRRAIALDGI